MSDKKFNILVVDDSKSSRYLYKTVFSNIGCFNLNLCGNVKEGLLIVEKKTPDLVILDMDLPDGSGIDILKYIRENNINSKVIIISAIKSSDMIIKSAKLGIDSYLIKPVDINMLVSKMKELLGMDNDVFQEEK